MTANLLLTRWENFVETSPIFAKLQKESPSYRCMRRSLEGNRDVENPKPVRGRRRKAARQPTEPWALLGPQLVVDGRIVFTGTYEVSLVGLGEY